FHEHKFLDHHLSKFPEKGPVRHFMELILVGLSKNPHMTIKEKISHIDWFEDYFKNNKSLF
ncbi:hypothetical protein HELRODRAFT_84655, partial [Helobdella robusta]|uniref:Small ribosomal subunit protein mS31 n=1 Tax=Helobdella robusta TaxID=6412 RepID=T1G5L4_HELRO